MEVLSWKRLRYLAIALIGLGLVIMFVEHVNNQNLAQYLSGLETRWSTAQSRWDTMNQTISQRSSQFAQHWTDELQRQVDNLQPVFASVPTSLQQARTLQSQGGGDPRVSGQTAEQQLQQLESLMGYVLGGPDQSPLGYYDLLQYQTTNAASYVESAGNAIIDARIYIQGLANDAEGWSVAHHVNYNSELDLLQPIATKLTEAQRLLTRPLAQDNVDVDLPNAYRAAELIFSEVSAARNAATTKDQQARSADQQIAAAQVAIQSARVYILASNYNQAAALVRLSQAEGTYDQALDRFWGNSERDVGVNYTIAYDRALLARSEADQAWVQAATPTPTPTPRPTSTPAPVIIIVDDDDDDYGFDFGSSSDSSYTSPSYGGGSSCCDTDFGSSFSSSGSSDGFFDDGYSSSSSGGSDGFFDDGFKPAHPALSSK